MVLLPRSYRAGDQPIPLVISPHGRGVSYKTNAHRWGNLPGIGGFAVVSPAGQGDHLRKYSWGARGQVDDLARMPDIVTAKVQRLDIDRSRIYAFGGSMGGQETLLLAARHPHMLAGAAALDSLVDFPRQYRNFPRLGCTPACERMWNGPIGFAMQKYAQREVGGTPRTAHGKYAARSPLTYARELAESCLPLQIWWSRYDRVVIDSSKQSGALFERIKAANPEAPVSGYVGPWQHAHPFTADRLLPHALAKFGLLPASYEQPLRRTQFIPPPTNTCTR
jgi:pimeloyl-ACP methyl ester carboxylesterase